MLEDDNYCVPNLELDEPVLDVDRFGLEIHSYRDIVLIQKLPMQVLMNQCCLPHPFT